MRSQQNACVKVKLGINSDLLDSIQLEIFNGLSNLAEQFLFINDGLA